MIRSLLFVFCVALPTEALLAAPPTFHYTVDAQRPAKKQVDVVLDASEYALSKTLYFQMPVWAPGAYSVTHYGKYVKNLVAISTKGDTLPVEQINDDRWKILAGKKLLRTISYSVLDSHKDSASLYFALAQFDSDVVFANATALFGYIDGHKESRFTARYNFPENWQSATALEVAATEEGRKFYKAHSYDELADAPILAAPELQVRSYNDGKATYEIALRSDRPFEMDSLLVVTKQITALQTRFFRDTPYTHYAFLINAPSILKLPSFVQGALEHSNSSAYLLVNVPWPYFKTFGPDILSHEFFHLWNVKRIHSALLGPFDYTQQVRTTSLWLSEGITDYYAHLLPTRGGMISGQEFLDDVYNWYAEYLRAPKHARNMSLEDLSKAESDFDLSNAGIFYSKGPLVGLMLDLEIRRQTGGKMSLDSVMLSLNELAKKKKFFADTSLISIVEHYSSTDLKHFYKRFIAGTDEIPLGEYLEEIGAAQHDRSVTFGENERGQLVITSLDPAGSLALSGVQPGDKIVSWNGEPLTLAAANALEMKKILILNLTLDRNGKEIKVELSPFREFPSGTPKIYFIDNPTPQQLRTRRALLGIS